jgi:hypothetical protein
MGIASIMASSLAVISSWPVLISAIISYWPGMIAASICSTSTAWQYNNQIQCTGQCDPTFDIKLLELCVTYRTGFGLNDWIY